MGNHVTIGRILLGVGGLILLLSVAADPIGIGGAASFGYKQIAGTSVGAVMASGGIVLLRARPRTE